MDDQMLRPIEDEPERGTDLLGAIEGNLRTLCGLAAESSSWRLTKLSRGNLLLLVHDTEALRLMVAEGLEHHEAYRQACERFSDDPTEGVRRAQEYVEAWSRRADERYDQDFRPPGPTNA